MDDKISRKMDFEHIIKDGDCAFSSENGSIGKEVGALSCKHCRYKVLLNDEEVHCSYNVNPKKENKEMKLKRIVLEKDSYSDYNITLPKIIEKGPCMESLKWVAKEFPYLDMDINQFYRHLMSLNRSSDAEWLKDNFSEHFNVNKDEDTIHIDDCPDNCIVWGRRVKEYKISINSTTYDTSLYDEDINWIMFVEGGEVTSTIHIKGGGALDKGELSDLMGSCSEYNHYFLIENSEQLKEVVDNHMNWFNK